MLFFTDVFCSHSIEKYRTIAHAVLFSPFPIYFLITSTYFIFYICVYFSEVTYQLI